MNRVGVCSWSLQPPDPDRLAEGLAAVGVDAVQLALGPLLTGDWPVQSTLERLTANGISVRSGMIGMHGEDYSSLESIRRTGGVRPDEHWQTNLANAQRAAELAGDIGLALVSLHAGFLPETAGDERRLMVERLRDIADAFARQRVRVAFETGQERAEVLLDVLHELERPDAGVNFDPANMLLYDRGDPVAALDLLAPRVLQVHVKDARRTRQSGTWGEEVPVGTGEVDWKAFFDVVRARGLGCDFMIEREAGGQRLADMRRARELVDEHLSGTTSSER